MSLQEKFQITSRQNSTGEADGHWVTDKQARHTGESGRLHKNNTRSADEVGGKFNMLPPGMDINDQARRTIEDMPRSLAGASDVSADTNPKALREGYKRHSLGGADDQYSGEHVDHFYGEAVGDDGNPGFVERNNYMDRL